MRGPISGWRGHVVASIIAITFTIAVVGFLYVRSGGVSATEPDYRIRAVVPTTSALGVRSRVTMAGIEVGRVRSVERRGAGAVVELSVDDDHAPVPVDTRARLRLRTLVGEKYVELIPGRSSRTLPDEGTLPLEQADEYVEVDEILSELRGTTRDRAREALQSLGVAVGARGEDLNELLEGASGMVTVGEPVVKDLAAQRRHITRLVANLGDLGGQVGDRGVALETLAEQMEATFTALGRRDDALRSVVEQLPGTLDRVRTTSTTLRRASTVGTPVLGRLATAVNGLSGTPALLRPAAVEGRKAVVALGAAAPGLERVLGSVQKLSGPATGTLAKLRTVFCELNPLVRYVSRYDRELVSVISGLGSAVNTYDANGHIARLGAGVGTNSLIGGVPPEVTRAKQTLLDAGIVQKINLLGYNPYPEPGQVNENKVGRGSTGPADAENKYRRVEADC